MITVRQQSYQSLQNYNRRRQERRRENEETIPDSEPEVFTLFDHSTETPGAGIADVSVSLGLTFKVDAPGFQINAIYFWKTATDTATTRTVGVFNIDTEALIIGGSSSDEVVGIAGWVKVNLNNPIALSAGFYYRAGVYFPNGEFALESGRFNSTVIRGPLTGVEDTDDLFHNGTFHYAGALQFPDGNGDGKNYWIDVDVTETVSEDWTLFDHITEIPGLGNVDGAVSLGLIFRITDPGSVVAVYFWKTVLDLATSRSVGIFDIDTQTLIVSGSSDEADESIPGAHWVKVNLDTPFVPTVGVYYKAAVHFPLGGYPVEANRFNHGNVIRGPIVAPDDPAFPNDTFTYDAALAYPSTSFGRPNYWVDISFVLS